MPHAQFLLLQVVDRKLAQAWLAKITPHIVAATQRERGAPKPVATAHVAFTRPGLQAIGLDGDTLSQFPREFTEGMSLGERPRVLGDTNASAPEKWQFGGPGTPVLHVLLALYGETPERMERLFAEPWYPSAPGTGLTIVYAQDTFRANDNEPFGFRDGISQPAVAGVPFTLDASQTLAPPPVAPGEFLLGYLNEYENTTPAPTAAPGMDPTNALPFDTTTPTQKAFALNGSFLVLRKLAQNYDGFWKFCEEASAALVGTPYAGDKIAVAAKLVGRWKSGCPLTLSAERDDTAIGIDDKRNNNFRFDATDAEGFACPIGAHARRSNPRDVLHPNNPKRSQQITNRHRLMRRGRPYPDNTLESIASAGEIGLIFIAINADLQRQFEFVQQTWLNSPAFNDLFNDSDPIVANNDAPGNMTIQREPARLTIHNIPSFVTTRGGGYFFLPGLRALRFLANLPEQGGAGDVEVGKTVEIVSPSEVEPETTGAGDKPDSGGVMTTLHDAWKAVLTEGHKLEEGLLNLRELLDKDLEGLMAKPGVVKAPFSIMRSIRQIFVVPHLAAVSLYPDVLEVLGNEAAFSVAPIYAEKMKATTGAFVLGMDDTQEYQTEIGLMKSAVVPDDIGLIRKTTEELAQLQVDAAAARGGKLDAVSELTRFVPNSLVGSYFGAPGPDIATNMRWMRSIFRHIFLNLSNDPKMKEEAEASSTEMNRYLDALIAQRKAELSSGSTLPDDFLCRLVKLQAKAGPPFADEVIRRIVGGTTVGTVDTNSKAAAQALEQILSRPLTLTDAHNAAVADDDDALAQIVFEALRFNPQNPFLLRKCELDTVLAVGTPREARIKAGSLVLVGTESAMFDPDMFPEPNVFRRDRPMENYIHFGHGLHTCFGHLLAGQIIPGTLKPLLKRTGLRTVNGGSIQYDGAFPNQFNVEFDVE